jgi:hypothetical protein
MIVDLKFPLEPFNTLVRNGTADQKMAAILDDIKPEAVYLSERDGKRGGILIVEVAEASRIPAIAEPFFLNFEASVEFRVAMGPEDMARAGLGELGKKWG